MPNDAYTLSFLVNELNNTLNGGKVNKITQAESDEIVLFIYAQNKTYKLLISANSSLPRIHLTENIKENPLTSFNFLMNLRKNLSGAEIKNITSVTCERIVIIEFLTKSDLKDPTTLKLYAELMGKHSNIILVDANKKILSAVKTVSLDTNLTRQIFPGLEYKIPAAKNNYCLDETDNIKKSLSENFEDDLENYLCKILRGISKSSAKEIIYISKVENKKCLTKADVENLVKAITEFDNFRKINKTAPCIIYANDAVDSYPFKYNSVDGRVENFKSLNLAFFALYDKKDNLKRLDEKSRQIRQVIKNNITKLNKKIALQKYKLDECGKKDEFKIFGELITSNIYKIAKGEEVLVCQNYYDQNKEIKIKLDKNLSTAKNAQSYYKKYNKLKTAESYAAKQLSESKDLLEYFLSVEQALGICTEISEINEITLELKKEGFLSESKRSKNLKKSDKQENSFKIALYKIFDFIVYSGKNNLQNDYLTFKVAKPNDIWMHAKDTHGSHTIISAENKTVPDSVIKAAAEIAAYNSKARESSKVVIDYTLKKYVKKPSGAKPGFVIYTGHKSIIVEPNENLTYKK